MEDFRSQLIAHYLAEGDSDGAEIVLKCRTLNPETIDCEVCAALYDMEFDAWPPGYDDGYVHVS